MAALHEAFPLRQCTQRLSPRASRLGACALAEMGRCGAPCEGREAVGEYAVHVAAVARPRSSDDPRELVGKPWPGAIRRLAAGAALRGGRRRSATGSPPSSAPPPACSGSPR